VVEAMTVESASAQMIQAVNASVIDTGATDPDKAQGSAAI